MRPIVLSSHLGIRPDAFWASQSMDSVNAELGPWIRMTVPVDWRGKALADWTAGAPLFKSWVLLLGVLPLDRHAFGALDLARPLSFVETSSSWMHRAWRHERRVEAAGEGCVVTDHLSFRPRLPGIAGLLRPIYAGVFAHRHARLRARYGATQ